MTDVRDVTIVGAGPVGLFGAFYAGLRGMSVRIVDSLEDAGGQLVALYPEKLVYDMPGFPEILAKDLAEGFFRQAQRFQPEIVLNQRCEKLVSSEGNWILSTDKGEYPSKTLILCAGVGAFSPTKLGVDRESDFVGNGLFYGVQSKEVFRDKRVVVVGGGDSALDWALALEGIASDLKLVHRRDGFRAHEDSIRKLMASTVELRLWEVVTELCGDEKIDAVRTENKQTHEVSTIECDEVIVNIGYKTTLGPLKDWGLALAKNKVAVNTKMETNLAGIYAAGDICTHEAKLDLIATGVGEVCIAVNYAKTYIDPAASAFPGHSSDMQLPDLQS